MNRYVGIIVAQREDDNSEMSYTHKRDDNPGTLDWKFIHGVSWEDMFRNSLGIKLKKHMGPQPMNVFEVNNQLYFI